MEKQRYVVGFLFTESKRAVLLVTKNRPAWQRGCLNGIGGHIEIGESPLAAMKREAFEECGLSPKWEHRGIMSGENNDGQKFECHIFSAFDDCIRDFEQKEDELLDIYRVDLCLKGRHISNLEFIIPFCICNDHSKSIKIEY